MRSAPAYSGGVYVTPIPGMPFSAVVRQEMTQVLKDGSFFQRKTSALIARDSQGRVHNESHEVLPVTATQDPGIMSIFLYDPNTRINYFLDPHTHVAQQRNPPYPPPTVPPNNWAQHEPAGVVLPANVQEEDLGGDVLQGFVVHGYRRTVTVSEDLSGTGKPVNVMDEYWYSEELRLDLIMKHNDPRIGLLVIAVENVNVGEPPADLFEVSPEYKVVDLNPPGREKPSRTR